jgi:hypothetical protein
MQCGVKVGTYLVRMGRKYTGFRRMSPTRTKRLGHPPVLAGSTRGLAFILVGLCAEAAWAVPAAPIMTPYRFNTRRATPYYSTVSVMSQKTPKRVGVIEQGTPLVPCVPLVNGQALHSSSGTPYVGFSVLLDIKKATAQSLELLGKRRLEQSRLQVLNHHCPALPKHVLKLKTLILAKSALVIEPPLSDLPSKKKVLLGKTSALEDVVRAFHASSQCVMAQSSLLDRRLSLKSAWSSFAKAHAAVVDKAKMSRARSLDMVLRTSLFEGHLDRGCSAYGACERNIIALSIRNRALGRCAAWQGCREKGDFEGVATSISQYNIWDIYPTQVSSLTGCFLRKELSRDPHYAKLQNMAAQSLGDLEAILFGDETRIAGLFPDNAMRQLKRLRHYYHPPAMGKCFPQHPRVEYISGAVARSGSNYVLIGNSRVSIGLKKTQGYLFKSFKWKSQARDDKIEIVDDFPTFYLDPSDVSLRQSRACTPYGVLPGCKFESIGRYRKPPYWAKSGKTLRLKCRVNSADASCAAPMTLSEVEVGGVCDVDMQPISGVY